MSAARRMLGQPVSFANGKPAAASREYQLGAQCRIGERRTALHVAKSDRQVTSGVDTDDAEVDAVAIEHGRERAGLCSTAPPDARHGALTP